MAANSGVRGKSSAGTLASTYALIYAFLQERSHYKAAAAVKRAAEGIIVLKDDVKHEGASLDEIIKWWKARKQANDNSASQSGSDSETSSDGDSSDSSDSSLSSSSDSSSSTSGSSSADSRRHSPGPDMVETSRITTAERQDNVSMKPNDGGLKKTAPKSTTSESSADSKSTSSASETAGAKQINQNTTPPVVKTPVVSSNTFVARAAKKRRTSDGGEAATTAIALETAESSPAPNHSGKSSGKKPRESNTRFQRIKTETVEFHDERLKNNAFMAKGGSANDYGAQANQDLIVTRGDGFRKEKNKKKRGSYRGGEITLQSHSIKFT